MIKKIIANSEPREEKTEKKKKPRKKI